MNNKEILKLANDFIVAQLQDRKGVFIPCIGHLAPIFQPEYILQQDGDRKLVPPSVAISYVPSEYLLRVQHYTTLDYTAPQEYVERSFIGNLADLHNLDERAVEHALVEYCRELLDGLFKGRRVALLGLGDLYVTEEVAGVLLLNFVPAPDLISALNFVFSVYKATSLRPDIELENTEVRYSEPEHQPSQHIISQPEPDIQEREGANSLGIVEPNDEFTEPNSLDITETNSGSRETKVLDITESNDEGSEINQYPNTEEKYEYKHNKKSSNLGLVWATVLLALILSGTTFYFARKSSTQVAPIEPIPQVTTSIDTVVNTTDPAIAVPLDTITVPKGGSLAKLAKEYYDNSFYWVYIFMANKDSIPNPNNLTPGQTIVIPPLEWYDLKSDPEEALHEAQEWSNLILGRLYTSFEEQRSTLKPFNRNE